MQERLIDRIYEAAFQPDCWPAVLNEVGRHARPHAGVLFVFDDMRPVRHKATRSSPRSPSSAPITGATAPRFLAAEEADVGFYRQRTFPAELMASDPCRTEMVAAGLDSEIVATIRCRLASCSPMVSAAWDDGSHSETDVQTLNGLLPHLARAGLMSARLGVEHARGTTQALQAIGLPAAVLTANGLVLSSNSLFEAMTGLFLPVAFGRLAVADVGANRLLQSAIESGIGETERVRSVPVAARNNRGACVIHILPVRHSANDLFPGGDLILAVSGVRKSSLVPSPQVLMGLFDLTPAEVRFATGLISGGSVQEVSAALGITQSSGRTFLARIFDKTGTHRQSELLSLLSSTHPFS